MASLETRGQVAKKARRIAGVIALATASLFLAFAIPEALLRLIRPAFTQNVFGMAEENLVGMGEMVTKTKRYQETHDIHQPANFLQPSSRLWSLVPGYRGDITRLPAIDGESATWRLEVNKWGFRGDPPSRGPGVTRVFCLGDSITFGDKLDEEDTYPRVLARLLRSRWPGRKVEVLNAGVPGYSSRQGVALWRDLRRYRPSAVVVGFGFNDTWPSRTTDRKSLPLDGSFLDRTRVLLERTKTYQALRLILLKTMKSVLPDRGSTLSQPIGRRVPIEETEVNVRTIAREARADGAFVVIAHFAFGHPDVGRILEKVAREENAPFVDFDALFISRHARQQVELARRLKLRGVCPGLPADSSGLSLRLRMPAGRPQRGALIAMILGGTPGSTRTVPLRDDGKGCDEHAGDAVYTGFVAAPPGQPLGFVFAERLPDGTVHEEFHGFPLTWRPAYAGLSPNGGPKVAPVETYNRFYLMSETIHPNAEGAQVIAEAIANLLDQPGRRELLFKSASRPKRSGNAS
jgi:lysophospholipase L1-like esterase